MQSKTGYDTKEKYTQLRESVEVGEVSVSEGDERVAMPSSGARSHLLVPLQGVSLLVRA